MDVRKNLILKMSKTKVFTGTERRCSVGTSAERKERAKLRFFTNWGKASLPQRQLDQGLRTIMEKIDEFFIRTPGLCCS
jgi:hypothetical protein